MKELGDQWEMFCFSFTDCKFNCHKRCFERSPRNCLGEIAAISRSEFNTTFISTNLNSDLISICRSFLIKFWSLLIRRTDFIVLAILTMKSVFLVSRRTSISKFKSSLKFVEVGFSLSSGKLECKRIGQQSYDFDDDNDDDDDYCYYEGKHSRICSLSEY